MSQSGFVLAWTSDYLFFLLVPLLDSFLAAVRHHTDAHVRRAVLVALAVTFRTVPLAYLMEDAPAQLYELQCWLPGVFNEDPDETCRKVALLCLVQSDIPSG